MPIVSQEKKDVKKMKYTTIIFPCGHEEVVQISGNINNIEGHINSLTCIKCAQDVNIKKTMINKNGVLTNQDTGERIINKIKE